METVEHRELNALLVVMDGYSKFTVRCVTGCHENGREFDM